MSVPRCLSNLLLLGMTCTTLPLYPQSTAALSAQGYYADPEVRVFENQYWIYPTRSVSADDPVIEQPAFNALQIELRKQHVIHQDYLLQTGLDDFSSPDLIHWTRHTSVLSIENVKWAAYAVWAPSAIHLNGKYYLFFAANDIQKTEKFQGGIGLAVSDNPGGPFIDTIGKPLIGRFEDAAQPIDPMVYRDDDGSIYLYFGGQGHCVVARLSNDLKQVIPMSDGQLYKEITPEHYVEGPFMIKRKGVYYFMWSEGDWGGADYGVAYARGNSPSGPFTRVGKILQSDPAIAKGPGHHSVLHIPNTDDWYIVYHRHPLNSEGISKRVLAIDKMVFDKNGNIEPVVITKDGPAARVLTSQRKD
ncbi:glycoside hydrolase family 43 protein [Occallatibacter savannae]|uniref:glycoside hydrolase family 43 protein n=1 Tax=Occallatibacter savannae TaxID=1002691 RepID=UPI001EF6B102|nr:glycoside hydrolase family 43 protein [Occallatibacter savannae]